MKEGFFLFAFVKGKLDEEKMIQVENLLRAVFPVTDFRVRAAEFDSFTEQGLCPKCSKTIPLYDLQCPFCKRSFSK